MRITKTLVCVFILTFLIGYVFVPSIRKEETISFESETEILQALPTPTEIKPKLEILEENNEWREEDDSKFKVKLLETGEGFHGNEIKAKSGETWLGFFKQNNDYYLRSTKIIIRRVSDPIGDELNQKTGKSVIVKDKFQPIFLIKNADMLRESKIKTLFHNSSDENFTSLSNGFEAEYYLNNKKYILRVEGETNSSRLILETEDKKQILFSLDKTGDTTWNLIWVGDLDGDGKLDLYANLPTFYNFLESRLFLSSQAENGKLIKQVAVFHISGC